MVRSIHISATVGSAMLSTSCPRITILFSTSWPASFTASVWTNQWRAFQPVAKRLTHLHWASPLTYPTNQRAPISQIFPAKTCPCARSWGKYLRRWYSDLDLLHLLLECHRLKCRPPGRRTCCSPCSCTKSSVSSSRTTVPSFRLRPHWSRKTLIKDLWAGDVFGNATNCNKINGKKLTSEHHA